MQSHSIAVFSILTFAVVGAGCTAPCNQLSALCDRAVNDVTFPATHNANAAIAYGYPGANANQLYGLTTQLRFGIRAFMLDVYDYNGQTVLCHGPCEIARTDHVETLLEFRDFLDENPREVIVFLYQDSITIEQMQADLDEAGLLATAYGHSSEDDWPTLGQLIENDTRLIVTTEHARGPQEWLHNLWDVAWDTPYSFDTKDDFSCGPYRGDPEHSLYLINHWLSGVYGLPSRAEATLANRVDVLTNRIETCWQQAEQRPNFVAVDWFDIGDLVDTIAEVNLQ